MNKVVITYTNADLDCVASAYAYAEYLNKLGEDANYYISGKVQKEVELVCSLFNIELRNIMEDISINQQVVVVDTNTQSAVGFVDPDQVVEVIDHHPKSGDVFEKAVMDIQQIGAVCTIIAERFKSKEIEPSREAAILLYYGIVSNTVNFNSKVTTQRDKNMAEWLKSICKEIDEESIKYIFREKSKFDISDLRRTAEVEEIFRLGKENLIIGQLEITEAKEFCRKNEEELREIITQVQKEYGVSIVFINIIDILEGYHIIYAPNKETQDFLSKRGWNFNSNFCLENNIVLRKEIKNKLMEELELCHWGCR